MTTQPGECERSAESCGAGACAAADNMNSMIRKTRPLTTEARRNGGESGMWSTAALGCGLVNCQLVSCFGLNDHVMENDFDLLMENASHSHEFMGYEICSAGGERLFGWGHNCSGREQKPESAIQIPGLGFLAFGPLVVARV